ncbi:helix-turn-helix domain-containing protein [Nonomuraea sp. FMUSA5-5]|uniref:Helix-turn-helix domain-containing protein n=1 Tax=Nonomuraea composti TaxID=2720023 RepID=A0ABX1BAN6_9ACTN|nr:helix-turn-helix domain-containing protein [Nonomuraea sp. FMUSA5-5]NJP94840.1 helix-turn-helix domain-containing protein [Nonomuraea sp. FMUSA5-5]
MHRVVVLALDGVIPFELGIASRIFGEATGASGEPLYEVIVCTVDGKPVVSSEGFAIGAAYDAGALDGADTMVIPPFTALGPVREHGRLPEPVAGALSRIRPGGRIVSICTGAYVLAAAGLLDGRPATTHWREAEAFQRTFPQVRVDPSVLFVDDGDVLTSAGAAAGVDLCLHLVRLDHGSEAANRAARGCVVPPWRDGGQAQYIERPIPEAAQATTAGTRAWALEQLEQPLTLAQLAAHARTSVRTFTRRFRQEVGMTAGQWLTRQRVERARRLLETTDLTIDQVGDRSGFGGPSSFRQHFRTIVGISPAAYRRSFPSPERVTPAVRGRPGSGG